MEKEVHYLKRVKLKYGPGQEYFTIGGQASLEWDLKPNLGLPKLSPSGYYRPDEKSTIDPELQLKDQILYKTDRDLEMVLEQRVITEDHGKKTEHIYRSTNRVIFPSIEELRYSYPDLNDGKYSHKISLFYGYFINVRVVAYASRILNLNKDLFPSDGSNRTSETPPEKIEITKYPQRDYGLINIGFYRTYGSGSKLITFENTEYREPNVTYGYPNWASRLEVALDYPDTSELHSGLSICQNQFHYSTNGAYTLELRRDDNLVLRGPNGDPLWTPDNNRLFTPENKRYLNRAEESFRLTMQENGDLCVWSDYFYGRDGRCRWKTNTNTEEYRGCSLKLEDDGSLSFMRNGVRISYLYNNHGKVR